MGSCIYAFTKRCPPAQKPNLPPRSFSVNAEGAGGELYEVVDVPDWGWKPLPDPDC